MAYRDFPYSVSDADEKEYIKEKIKRDRFKLLARVEKRNKAQREHYQELRDSFHRYLERKLAEEKQEEQYETQISDNIFVFNVNALKTEELDEDEEA